MIGMKQARVAGAVQCAQTSHHIVVPCVDKRFSVFFARHIHHHIAEMDVIDLIPSPEPLDGFNKVRAHFRGLHQYQE